MLFQTGSGTVRLYRGGENMQEWIIAMLVISVLLVLRDMAKVFFRGRSFLKAEQPAEEKNPQKE